ncbi:MAG: AAA family ATPase, partial [Chitinophagales bacterium]
MKTLTIIGGANGAGKTTFAEQFTKDKSLSFLNADKIAKKLEDKGISNANFKAGRIFFQRLAEYIEEEKDFVAESTLSGNYLLKVAKKVKAQGYKIELVYIFLDSPETCIQRVRARVLKGGHHIPREDVIRRYYRSFRNVWEGFAPLADKWWLIYNGSE